MIFKKSFVILALVFTFLNCKNKEELIISQIEISIEESTIFTDSIQSMLCIYAKPLNEDIFFPSHLIFEDNTKEQRAYLNKYDHENFLNSNSNLFYYIKYNKIKSEKDFEKLKSQVIQLEFYLPDGRKLKKDDNFQIKKSSFKYIDTRLDM
ncbi:hypothetical protein EB1_34950 [Empedobacter brevis NBRC 14943 = ATCC 43319]|uniref:Uncharacterized protein n=1 Tax=Empedobacter brevis NBRC 14943 = ATCC 43319 TaxID=1218108 RepID=A0A511NLN0_9FLAO|nr:hypothetical protein [Empedobacter brevis]GEM53705.1 hypothetical protein EB1_34950 [Empedobacter brevis NBRC 14943 = ATCC 43319]